jgi:hypothetical protein
MLHSLRDSQPIMESRTDDLGMPCLPVYVSNSDIYDVDMGGLAVDNPKTVIFTMQNQNPVHVGMHLQHTTVDVCICRGASWMVTGPSADQADTTSEHMANIAPHTFESARQSSDCDCKIKQDDNESWVDDGGNSSFTGQDDTRDWSPILEVKPRHFHIFSFHFSPFKPTLDSQRYLFHVPKEMNLLFSSPLQSMQINLHYHLLPGTAKTSVVPRSLQWTIGLHNAIIVNGQSTLRARSHANVAYSEENACRAAQSDVAEDKLAEFDISVQIYSINTSTHPHRFQIFNTQPQIVSFSQTSGHALPVSPPRSSEYLSWTTELTPVEMCSTFALVGDLPTDSLESFSLVNSGVRWHNLYSCLGQLLFGYNRSELKSLQQRSVDVVKLLYMQQFQQAHSEIANLRKAWMETVNRLSVGSSNSSVNGLIMTPNGGLPLSSFALLTKTRHAEISLDISNIVVHSPLTFMPETYALRLPPVTIDQVAVIFVEVYNPFAFPVSFAVVNSASGSSHSGGVRSADATTELNGFFYVGDDDLAAEMWASLLFQDLVDARLTQQQKDGRLQTDITDLLYEIENYASAVDAQSLKESASWAMTSTPSKHAHARRNKQTQGGKQGTVKKAANTNVPAINDPSEAAGTGEGKIHTPSRSPAPSQPKPGHVPTAAPSREGSIEGSSVYNIPTPFPTIGGLKSIFGDSSGRSDSEKVLRGSGTGSSSATATHVVSLSNSLLEQSIASLLGDSAGEFKSVEQGHKRPEFASVLSAHMKRVQLNSLSAHLVHSMIGTNLHNYVNHNYFAGDPLNGFYVMANFTLTKEFVAQPNSVVRIGPILFVPPRQENTGPVGAAAPASTVSTDPQVPRANNFDSIIYIRNNFTGVDRLDLSVSTAAAELQLVSMCVVKNGSLNNLTAEPSPCSFSVDDLPGGEDKIHDAIVEDAFTSMRITWANTGSVVGIVYDVSIDGKSCKDLPGVTRALTGVNVADRGPAPNPVLSSTASARRPTTGPVVAPTAPQTSAPTYQTTNRKHFNSGSAAATTYSISELCSEMPLTIIPKQQFSLEILALPTCAVSSQDLRVELFMHQRQHVLGDKANGILAKMHLHLSPARAAECLQFSHFKSPVGDALLVLCGVILCFLAVVQIWRLRNARAQIEKVACLVGKVAKKKRLRNVVAHVLPTDGDLFGDSGARSALIEESEPSSSKTRSTQGKRGLGMNGTLHTKDNSTGAEGVSVRHTDGSKLTANAIASLLTSSSAADALAALGPIPRKPGDDTAEIDVLSHVYQLQQRRLRQAAKPEHEASEQSEVHSRITPAMTQPPKEKKIESMKRKGKPAEEGDIDIRGCTSVTNGSAALTQGEATSSPLNRDATGMMSPGLGHTNEHVDSSNLQHELNTSYPQSSSRPFEADTVSLFSSLSGESGGTGQDSLNSFSSSFFDALLAPNEVNSVMQPPRAVYGRDDRLTPTAVNDLRGDHPFMLPPEATSDLSQTAHYGPPSTLSPMSPASPPPGFSFPEFGLDYASLSTSSTPQRKPLSSSPLQLSQPPAFSFGSPAHFSENNRRRGQYGPPGSLVRPTDEPVTQLTNAASFGSQDEDDDDANDLFTALMHTSLSGLLTPQQPDTGMRTLHASISNSALAPTSTATSTLLSRLSGSTPGNKMSMQIVSGSSSGLRHGQQQQAVYDGSRDLGGLLNSDYFSGELQDASLLVSPPPGLPSDLYRPSLQQAVSNSVVGEYGWPIPPPMYGNGRGQSGVNTASLAVDGNSLLFRGNDGNNIYGQHAVEEDLDGSLGFDIGSVADFVENSSSSFSQADEM